MKLHALKWMGGKSIASSQQIGQWIAAYLPMRRVYVESCFGMGGVLLQRPKAAVEHANDLDGDLVNWWRTMRDCPEELFELLSLTENSRAVVQEAIDIRDGPETAPLRRAWAFSILAQRCIGTPSTAGVRDWQASISTSPSGWHTILRRLRPVTERISAVQIDESDVCEHLERFVDVADAVIYLDPPYRSSPQSRRYRFSELDIDRLSELSRACKGFVAISGIGSEWDHLGWHREERVVTAAMSHMGTTSERAEVLWLNEAPRQAPSLLDLL